MDDHRNDRTPGDNGPNDPYGEQPGYGQGGPDRYGQQPGYGQTGPDRYGQQPGYNQGGPNQYGQQPGYDQTGLSQYGQEPGYGPGGGTAQGEKHKRNSIILGVIGLFLLGIILGPLALWQASKAEALGVKATAGKVLGWVDLVFGILGIFMIMTGGGPA